MTKERVMISASDFVADIRSGMTTSQLMKKYRLSARECQSLFRQLEEHSSDPRSLYRRETSDDADESTEKSVRLFPRLDVALPLAIYDVKRPESQGFVLDVSKGGLRVQGIQVQRDETLTLVVRADTLFRIEPVVFDAQCRWVRRKGRHGMHVAGLQITDISERNTQALQRLVQAVELANKQEDGTSAPSLHRVDTPVYAASQNAWKCPSCLMPQAREYDECPQCGIIVSKYLSQLDTTAGQIRQSVRRAEGVTIRVSVPKDLWAEAQTIGGDPEELVAEALDFYLKSRRLRGWRNGGRSASSTAGQSLH
jgi:hypothetical protein